MPELPEVETVRLGLLPATIGRTITGLRVGDFTGVVGPIGVETTRDLLHDRRIDGIERRGKYLFFALDDGLRLMVHLRMTGRLQVTDRAAPPLRFEHVAIELDDESDLRFADQRKFGRVVVLLPDAYVEVIGGIGAEPLEDAFTPARLAELLGRRKAKLKSALLDQRLVAGLGNIYVDEALFRARLHPERAAGSLDTADLGRLHDAIQSVLREALERRGTTFSSFSDAYGSSGDNQANLRVYGRGRRGDPCLVCGEPLVSIIVGGRTTHFCPNCQVGPPQES